MDKWAFLTIGLVSVGMFHMDIYFPIMVSVSLMALVIAYISKQIKIGRIGALVGMLFMIYLLPFIHIPPYLWFDFNSQPERLWGLAVNPYMLDEKIISLTAGWKNE